MKKLAFILLSIALMSSCAHKHKCACTAGAESTCTACKDAASKGESCGCNK
jgi:hypothetical protein